MGLNDWASMVKRQLDSGSALWLMQDRDGGTTVKDSSANGFDLTSRNALSTMRGAPAFADSVGAPQFHGVGSGSSDPSGDRFFRAADAAMAPGTGDWAAMVWVTGMRSTGNVQTLWARDDGSGNGMIIYATQPAAGTTLWVYTAGVSYTGTPSPPRLYDGATHLIGASRVSGVTYVTFDGAVVGSTSTLTGSPSSLGTTVGESGDNFYQNSGRIQAVAYLKTGVPPSSWPALFAAGMARRPVRLHRR